MSLNDIIRLGVQIANTVTADLQGTIQHAAWIRQDAMGAPIYGRRVNGLDIYGSDHTQPGISQELQCVIEESQKIREVAGRQVISFTTLVFPQQVPVNEMSTERREPFDPRDIIVLPSGKTAPIVDVKGVRDSETGNFYAVEVFLGDTLDRT